MPILYTKLTLRPGEKVSDVNSIQGQSSNDINLDVSLFTLGDLFWRRGHRKRALTKTDRRREVQPGLGLSPFPGIGQGFARLIIFSL